MMTVNEFDGDPNVDDDDDGDDNDYDGDDNDYDVDANDDDDDVDVKTCQQQQHQLCPNPVAGALLILMNHPTPLTK